MELVIVALAGLALGGTVRNIIEQNKLEQKVQLLEQTLKDNEWKLKEKEEKK